MHKFFKGLSRAFRCQAQTSSRNTSASSTQQDGVDDNSSGAQPTIRTRCVDSAHFLRGWHLDTSGCAAISGALFGVDQPAGYYTAQPPSSAWLSLPPCSPACVRRIQSIKDLALNEVRAYLASAVAEEVGNRARMEPLSSARRWLLGAARRWLADGSLAGGVTVARSVLSAGGASPSSSHAATVTASGQARLVLASDVKRSRGGADRAAGGLPAAAVAALRSASTEAGAFAATRQHAQDVELGTAGVRREQPAASASLPADTTVAATAVPAFGRQSGASSGGGAAATDKLQDRADAEAGLDAAVRRLLELIELGSGSTDGSGHRHAGTSGRAGDSGQQQRQRVHRPHPAELDLEGVLADGGSSSSVPGRVATGTATGVARAAPMNPAASFNLGLCYEHGWGVPLNKAQAAECYRRASTAGHLASCYNLAQLYLSGAVVDPSGQSAGANARKLMEQAANGNLAEAQTWLGAVSFEEGRYGAAFKLFEKAAKQNNALAQYYLGVCYENGFGIDASLEAAAGLYKKAAAAGVADAQYNLGIFYRGGLGGVPRDLMLAKDLFAQANRGNHTHSEGGALLSGQRNGSASTMQTADSDSDGRGGAVHKQACRQLSKSTSLPSFCYRINQSSADAMQDVVRGRSGALKIDLRGSSSVHMRNASLGSDASDSPASLSPEFDALSSNEHLFYIGDDDGMSDASSQFALSDDDSGQLLLGDDFPADAFGESLSNPHFGASLLVA